MNILLKRMMVITGPPVFICHEISPELVIEANDKGTAVVEVAWPVSGTIKTTKEMNVYELSKGKMTHIIHYGPYESCESTYLKLFDWIKEKGFRISGPIREVYPNDPREVPPDTTSERSLFLSAELLFTSLLFPFQAFARHGPYPRIYQTRDPVSRTI